MPYTARLLRPAFGVITHTFETVKIVINCIHTWVHTDLVSYVGWGFCINRHNKYMIIIYPFRLLTPMHWTSLNISKMT